MEAAAERVFLQRKSHLSHYLPGVSAELAAAGKGLYAAAALRHRLFAGARRGGHKEHSGRTRRERSAGLIAAAGHNSAGVTCFHFRYSPHLRRRGDSSVLVNRTALGVLPGYIRCTSVTAGDISYIIVHVTPNRFSEPGPGHRPRPRADDFNGIFLGIFSFLLPLVTKLLVRRFFGCLLVSGDLLCLLAWFRRVVDIVLYGAYRFEGKSLMDKIFCSVVLAYEAFEGVVCLSMTRVQANGPVPSRHW